MKSVTTDPRLGLPACLSIYPDNHQVQFLKSYFEKQLENGFYTALCTFLIPSDMGALFSSSWFCCPGFLFISSSKLSSWSAHSLTPGVHWSPTVHPVESGEQVGGGGEGCGFCKVQLQRTHGDKHQGRAAAEKGGALKLGKEQSPGDEGATGSRYLGLMDSAPVGTSRPMKHMPRVSTGIQRTGSEPRPIAQHCPVPCL